MFTEEDAAKRILENTKQIYVERHCYQIVNPNKFTHLDLNFYEKTKQELIDLDFWHIEDVENLTLKESFMNPQTFLRVCVSSDGIIQSAFYQVKPKIWFRIIFWLTRTKLSKAIDFETEFSDGSFITTSNAEMASLLDSPPQILAEFLPLQTPIKSLLTRHKQKVAEYIERKNVEPMKSFSLKEMLESQHRMEKIKSEFRERVGWMKKAEWDRMAKNPDQTSDQIYEEFAKARNESA